MKMKKFSFDGYYLLLVETTSLGAWLGGLTIVRAGAELGNIFLLRWLIMII